MTSKMREYKRQWAAKKRLTDPNFKIKERLNGMRSHERHKEKRLALARDWKSLNKEHVKKYRKEYLEKNIDKEKAANKIWRSTIGQQSEWKLKKSAMDKQYRVDNKEKIQAHRKSEQVKLRKNKRSRERYKNDPNYQLSLLLRSSLSQALRLYGGDKKCSVDKLIGCTIQELKDYLENKFKPGMSWLDRKQWHIDHKIPVSSFDFTSFDQQKKCFHFTNLQPLWSYENISKGKKVIDLE